MTTWPVLPTDRVDKTSQPPSVNRLPATLYNQHASVTNDHSTAIDKLNAGPRLTLAQFNADPLGVVDATGAIQNAVNAAKAAGVPLYDFGGTYKLTGTIDARCSLTPLGNATYDDFKGIIGAGKEATQFIQYTNNIPIFRFDGRYFTVKGFTAKFNTLQTVAQTAGNVFDLEDGIYFCIFDDLRISNGYIGFNSKDGARTDIGSMVFSNTFSNIRFEDNRYMHWRFSAFGGPSAGGTGNHISNIYMSSSGVDRMYRAIERNGGFEDVWNQLNIEHTCFEDCAFFDTAGDNLTINALHLEGVVFPCGSGNRAIVSTDGKGIVRLDVGIDSSFVGPYKISGITRSGSTATATIDLLDSTLSQHCLRVGDTIIVAGANQSQYNGTFTVGTVGSPTTFTYTVAGTPATPATAVSDYITVALGADIVAINIVDARAGAELIELDARLRDIRVTGRDDSVRPTMFRFAVARDANARVKLRNLSLRGQLNNAHLPAAIDVAAQSRLSNVITTYTRIPHRLRIGNNVFLDATVGYGVRSVASIVDPHAFTVNATGADAALARYPGDQIELITYGVTQRARAANVATLTIGTHNLLVGMRIRVSGTPFAYRAVNDYAISAVTATTISYINAGADEATTADTASSVMVFDAGVSMAAPTEPYDAMLLEEADWLYSGCEALDVGTVAAGAVATQTTTHIGVRPGDRIVWSPVAALPNGLQVQPVSTAVNTITWRAYNGTGTSIVSGVNLVHYKFSRS